jgi:hypothetical protein
MLAWRGSNHTERTSRYARHLDLSKDHWPPAGHTIEGARQEKLAGALDRELRRRQRRLANPFPD